MRSARTALAFGAVALGVLPLVACGTDRSVVTTAPSSVASVNAPPFGSIMTPAQFVHETTITTTTPITVGALVAGTSCPNLSFTVGTYVFRVNGSTHYAGGTCANIQPGSKVNFSGTQDSQHTLGPTISRMDGSNLLRRVEYTSEEPA